MRKFQEIWAVFKF